MLRHELEQKAIADYQAALGTVVTVKTLSGYKDDDCIDFDGVEFQVRVTETPESDLRHWVDEFLDPYWNCEPVGEYPQLAELRSFWTYGPSYKATQDGAQ